jgi:hypothetical protein
MSISLPEFITELTNTQRVISQARRVLPERADDAGEIIAIAYDIAGTGDDPTARGNEMERILLGLADDLESIEAQLKMAQQLTRRAVAAMDEGFARRKAARAKLGR